METILNNMPNPFTIVGVLAIGWVVGRLLRMCWVGLKNARAVYKAVVQDVTYLKKCDLQAPEKLDEIVNSKMHAVNALLRDVSITEENTNLRLKGLGRGARDLSTKLDRAFSKIQDINTGISQGFPGQQSELHVVHNKIHDRLLALEGSKEDEA